MPKNREAEQVLLGAAMLETDQVVPQLLEVLQPNDFYWKAHQIIYRTILELFDAGAPADPIAVGNRLEELKRLDDVGGRAYLNELVAKVTTTASVPYYAEIIKKKAMLRALIQAGHEIAELGFREEAELEELLDRAEEKVFEVSRFHIKQNYYLIRDFLHEHLAHLEKLQQDPSRHAVTGLPTGYRRFDEMTSGLQRSDLIIIAARPSVGKTSLALSIARHMALRYGYCVGIFSLEMTKEQLLERLLCAEARINLHRLRGGYLQTDSESWRRIIHAASKLQNSKILIDDTPSLSVLELKAKARRMKAEHGLDVLFVDYLQLIEAGSHSDVREQEVAYIARSLKGLARELDIPVVAISQLSRAPERPPRRPRLSDLRECVTGDTHVIDGETGNLIEVRHARPGMTVIALDRTQRLRPARVLDVIAKGVNQVYRVRTQTGREIRATAAHPFLTAAGWRPLRDLAPGALIATMRSVYLAGEPRPPELCRFLGYLTGDGTYLRHREVGFINSDPLLVQDVIDIARTHFDIEISTRRRFTSEQIAFVKKNADGYGRPYGNPVRNWLRELGLLGQRYDQKSAPPWVLTADAHGISEYLGGLFATDGTMVKRAEGYWDVKLSTTSLPLAKHVQYLLARLGIVAGIASGYKSVKATCPLYTVYVSRSEDNLRRFALLIPLRGKKALLAHELLHSAPRRRTNSGLESLPPSVSLLINQRRQEQGLSHAAVGYRGVGKRISRSRAAAVAERLSDPVLRQWATSDLLWERIVSITPEGEEPVWDLVVDEVHNFVANGIVVHNSGEIEQTADVVLFLYREETGSDESAENNEPEQTSAPLVHDTEIIIGKQRNGPTGVFNLLFHRAYTSFEEHFIVEPGTPPF
ncbi:MAG: replicative DNA helicase [Candidatus Bipolaricaulota bacterium]|nr:replicative DNA helicase [Candidatus Bipolaricaulota bacterium]